LTSCCFFVSGRDGGPARTDFIPVGKQAAAGAAVLTAASM
jgi:hypothetical protein